MKTMIAALQLVLLATGPTFATGSHTRHVWDGRPDTRSPQSTHAPQSGYYGGRRHEPRRLGAVIPGTADTQDAPPFHWGPWPIQNGFDQQPTEYELRALHYQDVTPGEAREIDRLYDQLLSSSGCPTGLREAMAC
jgi:hypothetical protein